MDDGHDFETIAIALDRLSHAVIELGAQAMESFKYAAAAFFDQAPEIAASALAASTTGSNMATEIHQNAVRALARWAPTGELLRQLIELQRSAAECGHMAEHARHIAECALMLSGSAERELSRLTPSAPRLMAGLVHQGYIALRGCLIVLTTHDRALARRIVAEDEEMHRLFDALRDIFDHGAAIQPQQATTFHALAYAANEFRQIGSRVNAICEDYLQ